jgi:hypothetical protein
MKRQLSNSDEKLSNKCLIKSKASSCYSSQSMNEYYVYWLDEFHNDLLKYYHVDQSKLRAIIDYLQTFNEFNQCETVVRENIGIKVFIIVNSSSCIKLLNSLNDLEEVHSIYTYKDNENIDQLFDNQCKNFTKVNSNSYEYFK